MRLSRFRRVQRLPGPAHPAVYDVAFSCRVRRRARRPRHARRARLGPRRRGRPGLLQRDDGSPRVHIRRARRAGGEQHQARTLALVLLLLLGGAATARLPVRVPPGGAPGGRIVLAARCPACAAHVGERRLAPSTSTFRSTPTARSTSSSGSSRPSSVSARSRRHSVRASSRPAPAGWSPDRWDGHPRQGSSHRAARADLRADHGERRPGRGAISGATPSGAAPPSCSTTAPASTG